MGRAFKYSGNEINDKWADYVEYMKNQYLEKPELIKSGERAGEVIYIKVYKPYTIESFCLFAGMNTDTFYSLLKGESENIDNNLTEAITRVHELIREQQISGGINGVYNPMTVARLNNLNDNSTVNLNANVAQINLTAPGSEPIDFGK